MNRHSSIMLMCVVLFLYSEIPSEAVLKKTESAVWSGASRILIPFVENKGQLEDPNVLFYSNTFAGRVSVNRDGTIGYRLVENKTGKAEKAHIIRERLGGAMKTSPCGEHKAIAKINHFEGNDPKRWVRDMATFNTVDIGEIYKGIQLKLQARGNNVEKIFHVRPAADPKNIRLQIEGAEALKLTPQGELEIDTGAGRMRFSKPVAYQHAGGRKTPVEVAYTVKGNAYGFQVAAYDKTKELIIDPLITAIFEGTSETKSRPTCMAADNDGNIYVAGNSASHHVVFKFDSKLETLLVSALFAAAYNGYRAPNVHDIAIDNQGAIYLAGCTIDKKFPVTEGAFDTDYTVAGWASEATDGFIIKFNAELNNRLAATYLGAGNYDAVYGLAVDPHDNVYVVGKTRNPVLSADSDADPFPTTEGAYDTTSGSYRKTKAFIARLDSNLQNLLASTLLGDNGDDDSLDHSAYDVAIDEDGNVVVAGGTQSKDFPITGDCADAEFQGEWEAFVAKFDPDLQSLLASTFLGGANSEKINVLRIDPNNEIVVAGWTLSSDFPVVQDNFDTSYNVYEDGFVTRLNNALTTIQASTFLGGDGVEQVAGMVILDDGTVFLCGGTGSSDFPTTQEAYDRIFNGGDTNDFYEGDGFLTVLDKSLKQCEGSTYLGGSYSDHVSAIVINKKTQDIVLAGETSSENFPYMLERKGYSDAFVCRFNTDEDPEPLPSARQGYWQSNESGSASSIHLDIDICEDGSFKGLWRGYFCFTNLGCFIGDTFPPEPVFGTIDFENNTGTITMGDDCKDLPLLIVKQSPDKLQLGINPGGETKKCLDSFSSYLNYQGQSENGKCDDVLTDSEKDNGNDSEEDKTPDNDKNKDSGGGGGCFINMIKRLKAD